MPSFDVINYGLRPSKSIQRQLVFNGIHSLQALMKLDMPLYVGLGSVSFTDFSLAHRLLQIRDMVSIESKKIGYRRAKFNSPYATIKVLYGVTEKVLPELLDCSEAINRPWILWLDYDCEFCEDVRDDIRLIIERVPENSIVLFTFNGNEMRYGRKPAQRPERLQTLFEDVVPDSLSANACKKGKIEVNLANFAINFMKATAANMSRPGGFVPAFNILYSDSASMITVGGVLPNNSLVDTVNDFLQSCAWECCPSEPIIAPNLTVKEALALQSLLPNGAGISKNDVRNLGFDLEEEHVRVYEKYYREYPTYAQVLI